jgi:hypothetical protein
MRDQRKCSTHPYGKSQKSRQTDVRIGCRDRHDLDAGRGENGVERRGELGVGVADEEPDAAYPLVEVHD